MLVGEGVWEERETGDRGVKGVKLSGEVKTSKFMDLEKREGRKEARVMGKERPPRPIKSLTPSHKRFSSLRAPPPQICISEGSFFCTLIYQEV